MEKFTIFKNKGETFKCQLNIEGAEIDETKVRLCLEFDDNKNLHFYGGLEKDGSCVIEIPKLEEIGNKEGKLTIEVIADSVFFKLYECEVDLKNSIEIKMVHKETTIAKESSISNKKISMTGLIQEGHKEEKSKEAVVENKGMMKFADFKKRFK